MRRSAIRSRKSPEVPIAWHEDEYAAVVAKAADLADDRVSDDIFDVEDERAEIDIIVQSRIERAN
jgi:hypothetical protein